MVHYLEKLQCFEDIGQLSGLKAHRILEGSSIQYLVTEGPESAYTILKFENS